MEDTEKYLIHAAITADGIVERSDVVGAIFGQTEGLLGDDLDLRDLQQSSKVGRIDVEIDSQNGQSFGTVTIASSLDRVKTAILAASLETITRVGPCRATVEVTDIEDVREAKRREVVERAKELLSQSFDESVMSSTEILDEVKESVRIEDISEYEGLPAGPRVADSDAVIVVEGRADVLTLLRYGIKNAIAVEGTNVPDAVADLTQARTTTAFFDGDRGGELLLRELTQVGDVDYVAFAPEGQSVEDLKRHEVFAALRDKTPVESLLEDGSLEVPSADNGDERPDPRRESPTTESAAHTPTGECRTDAARSDPGTDPSATSAENGRPSAVTPDDVADTAEDAAGTDGSAEAVGDADQDTPADDESAAAERADSDTAGDAEDDTTATEAAEAVDAEATPADAVQPSGSDSPSPTDGSPESADSSPDSPGGDDSDTDVTTGAESPRTASDSETATTGSADTADEDAVASATEDDTTTDRPRSLREHVREVIDDGSGRIRLLDDDLVTIGERPAAEAFDALAEADPVPFAAVVDGEFTQRLLDIAAQRGVDHAVAAETGEFVKKPAGVRLLTADQLANSVAS
ncbi:DNA primase DnaG [Halobellus marinus]|uniref:DNA primase DnaG n=1 Tax=Halobellus TaxID=1073986 RepID=UPI0028A875DB|nr:DNA primase DnaG [Halobellus sp. DFY28]